MLPHKPKTQKANTKRSDKKQSLITSTLLILFLSIFFLFPRNCPISRRLRRFTGYRIWECSLFSIFYSLSFPLLLLFSAKWLYFGAWEVIVSLCIGEWFYCFLFSLTLFFYLFSLCIFLGLAYFRGFLGYSVVVYGFGKVMV